MIKSMMTVSVQRGIVKELSRVSNNRRWRFYRHFIQYTGNFLENYGLRMDSLEGLEGSLEALMKSEGYRKGYKGNSKQTLKQ